MPGAGGPPRRDPFGLGPPGAPGPGRPMTPQQHAQQQQLQQQQHQQRHDHVSLDDRPADGGEAVGSTPQEFRTLIAEETAIWKRVIRESGVALE